MNLYNMGKKILGYNITLKVGEKVFAATTSNSFDITPNVKESQTKDDEGTKNKTVSGYEYSFGIDAVVELTEEGEKATRIWRDEAVEMTLLGEPVDFVYSVKGGKAYKGKAIISAFSEKSDPENEATISLTLQGVSKLTPVEPAA